MLSVEMSPHVFDQRHMAGAWDPTKERKETGAIHPGLQGKGKDRDDTTDPIFISNTWTTGLCVLLSSGQRSLKEFLILTNILCPHCLTRRCLTLKYLKNGEVAVSSLVFFFLSLQASGAM